MEPPFEFTVTSPAPERIECVYRGYIGEHDTAVLLRIHALLSAASSSVGVYYDVSEMTGFHRSQVQLHGEAFLKYRSSISGIALVGARPVIRFGAISVGLIARIQVKVFDERREALSWLGEQRTKSQVRPRA